eukprot:CAMPEP_0119209648 /NCGR_PEP_ID=MMETSP1327-20130426/1624_1 /TAXON_ID=38833 /ORGANISM="Micromonas pusilla, Strain RCC2306" /LENGTH=123 /DNA_ID=CAMNT_0007206521 /DNA_START=812 /DNA_END=1184 /DNA_ORIENTATION=-
MKNRLVSQRSAFKSLNVLFRKFWHRNAYTEVYTSSASRTFSINPPFHSLSFFLVCVSATTLSRRDLGILPVLFLPTRGDHLSASRRRKPRKLAAAAAAAASVTGDEGAAGPGDGGRRPEKGGA